MKLWAQVDGENNVTSVLQHDASGPEWLVENIGGNWIESPVSSGPSIPEVGKIWHAEWNAFLWEKPFDSWIFVAEVSDWRAPVDYPADGGSYRWEESSLSWVLAS